MGGASAIPFTAIDAWARRYGIEGDGFDEFLRLIRAADGAWLDWRSERRERTDG